MDEPREATRDGGPDRRVVETLVGAGAGAAFGMVAIYKSVLTRFAKAHG